jgi:CCR4-NOT transcription complex subunit 9
MASAVAMGAPGVGAGGGAPAAPQVSGAVAAEMTQLVLQLTDLNSGTRENALLELSKKREEFPDLAPMLWHSFGTVAALLQEIVSIYPALSPPSLLAAASNRVCNALALLQCVASHPETRSLFLQGAYGAAARGVHDQRAGAATPS